MDSALLQTIWTVVAFVFFVGVVFWAWSSGRKNDFDEAARMPLEDDEFSVTDKQQDSH